MAKFHIRDNGEPGRCVAEPGHCKYGAEEEHHGSPSDAREAYEQRQGGSSVATLTKTAKSTKSAATDRALEADLTYTGDTPDWMKDSIKAAQQTFGSTPEIIDVIDSPEGKLAVVWEPNSLAKNDSYMPERGYIVTRVILRNMQTGSIRGYLKTTHVDDESMKIGFGDDGYESLRYMSDASGSNYGTHRWEKTGEKDERGYEISDEVDVIRSASTPEELIEAKRHIWAASHRAENLSIEVNGEHKAPYNISDSDAPTDEKQLDKDLKKIIRRTKKEFAEFKKTHGDPYIDFSKVEDDLKGTGIGSALYVYSARMHAKKDRSIRGSTIQTEFAQSVWSRFAQNDKLPVKKTVKTNPRSKEKSDVYVMDFRETA